MRTWPATTTRAEEVASHLIYMAEADEESERLSPMRLQKLLYYTQGWGIACLERPIFREKIKAWTYGPVVPQIFHQFKAHGKNGIPPEAVEVPRTMEPSELTLIQSVWATYRAYSAVSLSEMTHNEDPWKEARGSLPLEASCENEIDLDSLYRYFSKHVSK